MTIMNLRTMLLGLAGTGVALALAAGPAAAADLCKGGPKDQWMAADAIKGKAQGMGYEVRRLGQEDGCYEVKGMKDGKRVEAYFDPVTGEVVKVKGES
jgi:hypothetical protein